MPLAPLDLEGPERRAALVAGLRAEPGIDEALIERMVRAFYGGAREDALLGPIFAAHLGDWEAHIERLCRFWSSVTLM
ncbi:MAG: hypothetical protein ACP5NI_06035, partial [Acetobacteraceae bacterium]